MILQSLRSQLHEPPDTVIRILLLAMAGLIPYLIVDWSYERTSRMIKDIEAERTTIQNEITTSNAMIGQIPVLDKNIQRLQSEVDAVKAEMRTVYEQITRCTHQDVLRVLQQFTGDRGPFSGFTVQTNSNVLGFSESVYHIRMEGSYVQLLEGLKAMEESVCAGHVTRWSLSRREEDGKILTGLIQVSVYQQKVNTP